MSNLPGKISFGVDFLKDSHLGLFEDESMFPKLVIRCMIYLLENIEACRLLLINKKLIIMYTFEYLISNRIVKPKDMHDKCQLSSRSKKRKPTFNFSHILRPKLTPSLQLTPSVTTSN